MDEREKMIRLWFSMWLEKKDLGIDDIFAENVIYTESWGPCYRNRETIKHWFQEWNTRGSVIAWDIKQFFHGILKILWIMETSKNLMESL